MLLDPRIYFGLNLLKGPICTYTKFFSEEEAENPTLGESLKQFNYHFPYVIKCKNKDQEAYIIQQYKRLWNTSIFHILACLDWGYSGNEVLYKKNVKGQVVFDKLISIHPNMGARCHIRNGGICGFSTSTNPKVIPIGKGMWTVHQPHLHSYYGQSQLKGAHIPWHETWMLGGARDIRRTWFFRCAYNGGNLYYPEGMYTDENGVQHPNEQLAARIAEQKRSGSTGLFPATKGLDGKRAWEFEEPAANMTPQGMEQYISLLRDEELEGLGIPPEVVSNGGSDGLGAATGRMVPLTAWLATLTPISNNCINTFREQVVDPILLPANNFTDDYEIEQLIPASEEVEIPTQTKTIPDSGIK
jgi:phage pi2 protein 07